MSTGPATEARRGRRRVVALVAVVVAALAVAGVAVALLVGRSDDPPPRAAREPEVQTYVIEAGTYDRLLSGEIVNAIPTEIRLRVGDRLVVRNEDVKGFEVGPYSVRPGDTLEQEFLRPQTLIGECLVSRNGQVRIVVS